jgi:diacylglycerol kinase family enzyme
MASIGQAGHRPDYRSSKDKDWHLALEQPADLVAVAGGDGTVAKVGKRLIQRDTPLTILPLGTANNIFKTLYPPTPIEDLIAGWATARRRSSDLGSVRGPWGNASFIESFGIGLLARMISDSDSRASRAIPDPTTQPEAFFKQVAELTLTYPARHVKVVLDGRDLSGEYVLLEAMNTKFIGPNFCLAPAAEPDDGFIDLVLLGSDERKRLVNYLAARAENPLEPGLFLARKGEHLLVEFQDRDVHIDDEVWRDKDSSSFPSPSVVHVDVDGSALEFVVPC